MRRSYETDIQEDGVMMSEGERSCTHYQDGTCPCTDAETSLTCNAQCKHYKWDKKTEIDTYSKAPDSMSDEDIAKAKRILDRM